VKLPAVVIRPIATKSVNHSAPSGPAVMLVGILPLANPPLLGVIPGNGTGYSVTTPVVVIRPILLATPSVNHSAPSGPVVISSPITLVISKADTLLGRGYSVMTPAVVIRPIRGAASVNQSAPSGPTVIAVGRLSAVGTG
jgi:hypothetical protein